MDTFECIKSTDTDSTRSNTRIRTNTLALLFSIDIATNNPKHIIIIHTRLSWSMQKLHANEWTFYFDFTCFPCTNLSFIASGQSAILYAGTSDRENSFCWHAQLRCGWGGVSRAKWIEREAVAGIITSRKKSFKARAFCSEELNHGWYVEYNSLKWNRRKPFKFYTFCTVLLF